MIDPWLFTAAVLALLATPGPTNTLLAASGATIGIRRSLRLLPIELAAYLLAIELLRWLGTPLLAAHAGLALAIKLAAATWLVWSAFRLWRHARLRTIAEPVLPMRVLVTTLLNPKALIFALAIFPPPGREWAAVLFAALCPMVGFAWILFGRFAGTTPLLRAPADSWRVCAVAHLLFALLITGSALGLAG